MQVGEAKTGKSSDELVLSYYKPINYLVYGARGGYLKCYYKQRLMERSAGLTGFLRRHKPRNDLVNIRIVIREIRSKEIRHLNHRGDLLEPSVKFEHRYSHPMTALDWLCGESFPDKGWATDWAELPREFPDLERGATS